MEKQFHNYEYELKTLSREKTITDSIIENYREELISKLSDKSLFETIVEPKKNKNKFWYKIKNLF